MKIKTTSPEQILKNAKMEWAIPVLETILVTKETNSESGNTSDGESGLEFGPS